MPNPQPTPPRAPVIASFPSCGVERLRALLDCLTLESTPSIQPPRFILGATPEPHTLEHDLRAAANARVILLARDPRRVVVDNYLIARAAQPHATPAATLDDFLCAPPGEPTPESRFGLRAHLAFMSAIARASHSFHALLIIDADELSADPWGTMRQIADFLQLPITHEQWARAAQRAGPLTHPARETHTHPATPTPTPNLTSGLSPAAADPFAPYAAPSNPSHSAARAALDLSAGQLVFANHTITEHLHPMLSRYRKDKQPKPHTLPSRSKAA